MHCTVYLADATYAFFFRVYRVSRYLTKQSTLVSQLEQISIFSNHFRYRSRLDWHFIWQNISAPRRWLSVDSVCKREKRTRQQFLDVFYLIRGCKIPLSHNLSSSALRLVLSRLLPMEKCAFQQGKQYSEHFVKYIYKDYKSRIIISLPKDTVVRDFQ